MSSSPRMQQRIKSFLIFLESIPDILLILVSQILVVWFLNKQVFYLFKLLQLEASRLGVANIVFEHPDYDYVCKMVVLRFENELEKIMYYLLRRKGWGAFIF